MLNILPFPCDLGSVGSKTRSEIQSFCGIASREYFREKVLQPLIQLKKISLTIPDKPQVAQSKNIIQISERTL